MATGTCSASARRVFTPNASKFSSNHAPWWIHLRCVGGLQKLGIGLLFALLLATLWPWKLRAMKPLFGSFKFQRLHKTSFQITAMRR